MEIRINRFLSDAGFCSRRAADTLISEGRVSVDGKTALIGQKVNENSRIQVDGQLICPNKKNILIAFNKPVGIVCTATDKQGKNNVIDFLGLKERVYPIGRLDKDSQGLLLLTNNGDITYKMLDAGKLHEKEYIVETDKDITDEFLKKMSAGIYLKDLKKKTAKCKVRGIYKNKGETTKVFSIILVQGLNRQIRRMCEACGYRVKSLKRIRIMNIKLGNLPVGKYRDINGQEYEELIKKLNAEG